MVKSGKATGVRPRLFDPVERKINDFFIEVIYAPLIKSLEDAGLENAAPIDPVTDALKKGRLTYQDGYFVGKYNSRITAQLKKLGATYDKKRKQFKLPQSMLTPDMSSAVVISDARARAATSKLIDQLDKIDIDESLSQMTLPFDNVAGSINADLQDAVEGIAVMPKLTDEMRLNIQKDWSENLKLYIKEWSDNSILELRRKVEANTLQGNRAADLEKMIMDSYGSSKNKARFLARQETSLLYSRMREERYKDAGITKYKWVTNMDGRERDRHADLNGKTFYWDTPPVIDDKGNRGHPGDAFNCRCRARPIR